MAANGTATSTNRSRSASRRTTRCIDPGGRLSPSAAPRPRRAAEHWAADAGARDVVRLDIPADAERERRFELFCQLVVVNRSGRAGARHGLRVTVDGALEWERSVATDDGGTDTLELRFARSVPIGRPLRIVATCTLAGVQRQRLTLTADEE